MNQSPTITELAKALARLQGELPAVEMDKRNPYFNSSYASLGAVIKVAKPLLSKHGFSIVQTPVNRHVEGIHMIGVDTLLLHESGEWLQDVCYVAMDIKTESGEEKKSKISLAQKAGISISYLKRYAYVSMLGIYAEEDTDGNMPTTEENPDAEKNAVARSQIGKLITENAGNKDVVTAYRTIFKEYHPKGDLNFVEESKYPEILEKMKGVKGEENGIKN